MRTLTFKSGYLSFVFGILVLFFYSSCISPKKIYYFSDLTPGSQPLESSKLYNLHTIHTNDQLSITISCPDPTLTTFLGNNSSDGYLVDFDGTIQFPVLGKVKVTGLTANETEALIKEKLSYFFKDLFVSVKFVEKVYFLTGKGGGSMPIPNERLTILEALTQMPGFDPFTVKLNKVWIIREDSGKRFFAKIDLNSKELFKSQYFYLKNKDVLYIRNRMGTYASRSTVNLKMASTLLGSVLAFYITIKSLNL